jgi:hypothetical protein
VRQPTFSVLLLLLAATALSAEPEDQLAAGKQLVAQLKLDQDADATLFRQIGTERASTLLSAVMQHGQSNTSSPADWADLHRATAGLVELHAAKGDLFKASMYAGFQSMFYRNFEGDYTAALAASRQALQLQQESGVTATLWISWSNVGKNYQSLGNLDEAVRHLREAQRLQTDTTRPSAAYLWRDIVDCEIGRKNLEAARRESEAFLHQAESGTPVFKATALMARSDVLIAENKYSDAVDTVKTARALVTDPVEAQTFALDVVNQLMTCVLDSMTSLPYPQAIALAKQMDVDMPGLPIPIGAFAEQSIRSRRRMAGEIDAVLREDTARLQQARAAASVPGQIEILRSLAVTYGAANAPAQRAALLEEALGLERSLLPKNGIPENAGSVYSFFRLLVSLGDVYVDLKDLGKARRNFDEAARGIESLPSAGLQKYAASLYGQAMLGKARVAELDDDPDTARDILKAALSGAAKGKYDRAGVLRQAAYLERSLGEQPAAALAYYEQAIEAMQSAHDKHSELATRLELARYLATDAGHATSRRRLYRAAPPHCRSG